MDEHTPTRISLHAVAEVLLAGPQFERSQTIRLRVTQAGFATVAEPALRVSGTEIVRPDGHRVPLVGTLAEVADAVGVKVTVPPLYPDHAGLAEHDRVNVDARAAARIAAWFERGRQALARVAPAVPAVLWPEHFDLAVTVGEVNLGVSAGDSYSAQPYAYVGPWSFDASAEPFVRSSFWTAPFGASLPIDAAPDATALARFFAAGLASAAGPRQVP